jgi:hypothetical protein
MRGREIVAALIGVALVASAAEAADARHRRPMGVNARQHRQAERIEDGVENKQLTKRELDKLRADEAGIRAEERVYRRSGDGLSRWERRDLEHDLNRTSREIYRAKHNNRKPQ